MLQADVVADLALQWPGVHQCWIQPSDEPAIADAFVRCDASVRVDIQRYIKSHMPMEIHTRVHFVDRITLPADQPSPQQDAQGH